MKLVLVLLDTYENLNLKTYNSRLCNFYLSTKIVERLVDKPQKCGLFITLMPVCNRTMPRLTPGHYET
jgi:hypothetical protein